MHPQEAPLIKRVRGRAHPRRTTSASTSLKKQAADTDGVVLDKIGTQYWHRGLNIKKLVEIGFTHLHARTTMSRCRQTSASSAR